MHCTGGVSAQGDVCLGGCLPHSPGTRGRQLPLWTERHMWKHNLYKLHLQVVTRRYFSRKPLADSLGYEQVWTCPGLVSLYGEGRGAGQESGGGVSPHMTSDWRMVSWVMVTWRLPSLGRQTDRTENITCLQLRWRAVNSIAFRAETPYTYALHISLQRNHILS